MNTERSLLSAPIGIAAIGDYLPDRIVGNEELAARYGFDQDFLANKVGILERRIADPDEAVSDMAVKAAERLLQNSNIARDQIGLLVICTQNPDYKLPATANIVQQRLGLTDNLAAFDINQGCSGYVYSLAVAKSMMAMHRIRHGIVITSEAYSKVIDPADRDTSPLFGDGATATLLSWDAPLRIGEFSFGSDGSGAEELIVRAGGSRYPHRACLGRDALYMNGRAVFNFMMRRVPKDTDDCLTANHLDRKDIDLFLFHQANKFMLESLRRSMKLPENKVPIHVSHTGNTVSNTIPLLIQQIGGVSTLIGKRALLSGFGVGLSWASTVLFGRD